MTEVREVGQWCGGGGRNNDPVACNNAYVITFPSGANYFRTPHEYRSPNVRVQRQRCVHNNKEGAEAKCVMEDEKYQCAIPTSVSSEAIGMDSFAAGQVP
eukprot:6194379-Pleurochrysis_carterae.AAC.1